MVDPKSIQPGSEPVKPGTASKGEDGMKTIAVTPSQMNDIEEALRVWIGQLHHEACTNARLHQVSGRLEWLNARYEHALDTYRAVVGMEPCAEG